MDVTGDGIADYVFRDDANAWWVAPGTGLGFAPRMPVTTSDTNSAFVLSVAQLNCAGTELDRTSGLFDLDGDHRPVFVSATRMVYALAGPNNALGAPAAGRLVGIDNGFGAATDIQYRSVKGDGGLHQVPSSEIVVDSVTTTGAHDLGGTLSAVRYAYGGAELVFDPAYDTFIFPGYRRRIELQDPIAQPAGMGTIVITDAYAPVSADNPYGLAVDSSVTEAQRYAFWRRIGRVSDVTVLAGDFGTTALATPSSLLTLNVNSDPRRIGGVHYEWNARPLASTSDPLGPEPCSEMQFPYDYAASTTFDSTHDHVDACTLHGFGFLASTDAFHGEPGAAPSSTANVATRSEVRAIDDLGRVRIFAQLNDIHRDDDDLCVITEFAQPTGTTERQLHAASAQTVTNCALSPAILAKEHFEYDRLAEGSVAAGFPTAHTVERRGEDGALLTTIRQFDATFDDFGNPTIVTTQREDGARRTATAVFDDNDDPFHLAPSAIITTATGVATTQISFTRDKLTRQVLFTTDPNGTRRGVALDGFDRVEQSILIPPGGAPGSLSFTRYEGFSGNDAQGRRITQTVFIEQVDPANAPTTPGHAATVYLDELGRERSTQIELGAKYGGQRLIVGERHYDRHGRVVFEADPYPSSQSGNTAYGTTQFFNPDGTLHYAVRARGEQQPVFDGTKHQVITTDETNEVLPTQFLRRFEDNTEIVEVQGADSLLAGSPQSGVTRRSALTAIGRLLSRSTWQDSTRLEYATFAHDRLGRQTGMTRYQDANAGAQPVTSSWHFDSLGQLLELDEPGSVPAVQHVQ